MPRTVNSTVSTSPFLSARIVAGRIVHGTDRAVGKGCSIEAGSSLGVLVVPQATCWHG